MVAQIHFNGTTQEGNDLLKAIAHNCQCTYGLMGVRTSTCPAHHMLIDSQRVLDHLLFMRRIEGRLNRQEWVGDPSPSLPRNYP